MYVVYVKQDNSDLNLFLSYLEVFNRVTNYQTDFLVEMAGSAGFLENGGRVLTWL